MRLNASLFSLGATAAMCILTALPSQAAAITGILQLNGGLVAVNGSPTTGCIDFYNLSTSCGTPGAYTVGTSGNTGVFTAASGTIGAIKDVQTSFPLLQFITVPAVGVFFDFNNVTLNASTTGSCPSTALNASCSPANSPFTLTNSNTVDPSTGQAASVTVKFDVNLIGYAGSASTGFTNYTGTFTTQLTPGLVPGFPDSNISSVLAAITTGTISGATWSATLSPVSAVPEPASVGLLCGGLSLIGLGLIRRKK